MVPQRASASVFNNLAVLRKEFLRSFRKTSANGFRKCFQGLVRFAEGDFRSFRKTSAKGLLDRLQDGDHGDREDGGVRRDGRGHPPPPLLDACEGLACLPVGCGHDRQGQGCYTPLLLLRGLGDPARLGITEDGRLQLLVQAHDIILLELDADILRHHLGVEVPDG